MNDNLSGEELAKYIDHTVLKADATLEQVDRLCVEAVKYNFYSVCVNSTWTKRCAENLAGSDVKIAVTIGFPLGAMSTDSKVFEAKNAVKDGAGEIDMVINVGELKSGRHEQVEEDISAVKDACGSQVLLKCIIETALLTDDEKVQACELAEEAGADFVKTSTGFSTAGATVADVALMRKTVGPDIGVKASGGVRTYEDAVNMIKAGANRLGTSASIEIVASCNQ